jgi:predicted lipid-binding transport protein (Tim44 family)
LVNGFSLYMARDRVIGAALVVGAIVGVIIYGLLMFAFGSAISLIVLEISAFIAVLAVLAILGWIGYVMATTPPPVPLEPEPATASSSSSSTSANEGSTATPTADKPQQA